MLVEFSVTNFRSVKTRQTLSMVPGSSQSVRKRHVIETDVPSVPNVLRAVGIYGANGSGKSSVINAMEFARRFVRESAGSQRGDPIRVKAYLFSPLTRTRPSEFEFIFALGDVLYQYGFAVDTERVWGEWLFVTPAGGRNQRWIERRFDRERSEYETYINPTVPGEKKVWKDSTRDNALLLSVANQLNAVPLAEPFRWLSDFRTIQTHERIDPAFTAQMYASGERQRIRSFLHGLDVNISDVRLKERDLESEDSFVRLPEELKGYLLRTLSGVKMHEVSLCHIADDGEEIALPFQEESDGTQALFSLAGAWILVAEKRLTLAVDELHNSLHPLAFRYLIENFFSGSPKKKGGQLIFTSHNTLAMESRTLHRDQIVLVENHVSTGTVLTPLSDFKTRAGESFRAGYLGGRYGGIPSIADQDLLPFHDGEDAD